MQAGTWHGRKRNKSAVIPFIALCLANSFTLSAQNSREPHFVDHPINTRPIKFGWNAKSPLDRESVAFALRAGGTWATLTGPLVFVDTKGNATLTATGKPTGKPTVSWIPGYVAGLQVEIPFADNLYAQPELDYMRSGAKLADAVNSNTLHLTSLDLPLLLKYKPLNGVNLFAGVAAGYLLSANEKTSSASSQVSNQTISSAFHKGQLSWTGGAGYGFSSGLGLDLRYMQSLGSVSKQPGPKIMSSMAQLSLRYFFYEL